MTVVPSDIESAVAQAIKDDLTWQRQATPSVDNPQPRVTVRDGASQAARRPFRHRGNWSVRRNGIARLTAPLQVDGHIVFTPDWS